MQEWLREKNRIALEFLKSDRFKNSVSALGDIVPFPFAIRNGQEYFFSTGHFLPHFKRTLSVTEQIHLLCELGKTEPERARLFSDFLQSWLQSQIIPEYEITSLSKELLERYEELNLLYDFSQNIGMVISTRKIFDLVLEKILAVLEVERASIMLLDEKNRTLEVVAARGYDPSALESPKISVEKSISGYVIARGEPLLIEDISALPPDLKLTRSKEYKTRSFITVPMIISVLQVKGKKLGVINVTEKKNGDSFSSGDLKLLNSMASLAAIAIYNNHLLGKVLESERLKRDLEIAEKIQLQLLPTHFPEEDDIELFGRCQSAKNIGGDYFDFYLHPKNHLDLLIADVSGHNVSAALMMANTRSVLRSLLHQGLEVNEILQKANHLLYEDLVKAGFFISIFLFRYFRDSGRYELANGGHHPALLYRPEERAFKTLDADGMLLGILPDVQFERKGGMMYPGDVLVMFTDGILEAANGSEEFFQIDRLKKTVVAVGAKSAREIVDGLFESVRRFRGKMSQNDDITLQVFRRKPEKGSG